MAERVRIADIAEELGLSTATVSNVIHGKTKKISDETVKRVQALLEERQYCLLYTSDAADEEVCV